MAKKLRAVNVAGRLMLLGLSLGLFQAPAVRRERLATMARNVNLPVAMGEQNHSYGG